MTQTHFSDEIKTVIDTVVDGFIIIDDAGYIQCFNTAATRIFGYQEEEVIGNKINILMPEPFQSSHDQYLVNFLTTGNKKIIGTGREITAQRKNGDVFPMELSVNELPFNNQRFFLGTIRDISERKAAEQNIQLYLERLKNSNEELDQFAHIASHDLKEPLRGLANNALFLEEDYNDILPDKAKHRIHRLRFLCDRMEQLVDSLLYYSRLGRQELAVDSINLGELLHNVVELTVLEDSDAQIHWPNNLPDINCDVPRTKELFRNLISNALKYNNSSPKKINIGITTMPLPFSTGEEQRVFYIRDNGIGIEKHFFDDIFRIFKRLNDENDTLRGTGVGLTFVKKIVERQGGHIWLESEVGVGTCFYFTLNMEEHDGK